MIRGNAMFDIEEELKKLPGKPGVYIMHDKHDTIIYIAQNTADGCEYCIF